MRPTCPKCGSENIVEWNLTMTRYPVESVELDRFGDMAPEDYGVAEAEWETSEVCTGPDSFQCRECDHEFADFSHMEAT